MFLATGRRLSLIRSLGQSYDLGHTWICALLLLAVVSGALLSSEAAGLAIPYWPFSAAGWMQRPLDGVFWNYTHRLAGLSLLLLGWRSGAKWVLYALIVFAIASGAYGVKWGLPAWSVIIHALSAHLVVAGLAILFVETFKAANSSKEVLFWVWATPVLMLVQIVIGTLLRHMTVYRMPGYVKAVYGLPWLVLVHVLLGLAVMSLVCWTAFLCHKEYEAGFCARLATVTIFCVAIQFVLGLGAYVFRLLSKGDLQPSAPLVAATTLHVLGGALTLGVQTMLALRVTFSDHSTTEIGERIERRGDEH